ncbi:hypothetical protein [uncultured Campylobacter sp.]|uniref:hypothetical protein n=1 Tax=uncultured Campylobacter sp. TaxID=218934 RepID=UPI0026080041|nr:hypothetical protein [uncultured Campylobacter sp.]
MQVKNINFYSGESIKTSPKKELYDERGFQSVLDKQIKDVSEVKNALTLESYTAYIVSNLDISSYEKSSINMAIGSAIGVLDLVKAYERAGRIDTERFLQYAEEERINIMKDKSKEELGELIIETASLLQSDEVLLGRRIRGEIPLSNEQYRAQKQDGANVLKAVYKEMFGVEAVVPKFSHDLSRLDISGLRDDSFLKSLEKSKSSLNPFEFMNGESSLTHTQIQEIKEMINSYERLDTEALASLLEKI